MALSEEFQPIILAGGFGSRLHPLVEETPKALLPVCNRPLLAYELELLEKTGFYEVTILTRQSVGETIKRYIDKQYSGKLRVEVISQADYFGTAQALLSIKDRIKKQFIVISGDLLVDPTFVHSMVDQHRSRDATVTMLLKEKLAPPAGPGQKSEPVRTGDIIGLDEDKSRLLFIASADDYVDTPLKIKTSLLDRFPVVKLFNNIMDAHFYIFSRAALDLLERQKSISSLKYEFIPQLLRCQYHPHLADGINTKTLQDQALSMSSTFHDDSDRIKCLVYLLDQKQYCGRANTLQNFMEVNRETATGTHYFKPAEQLQKKSFISTSATISKQTQIGTDCVIGDGSSIGDRCAVKYAIIGKHCQIGNNVKIISSVIMDHVTIKDGSKIQNSIVCNNAYLNDNVNLTETYIGPSFTVEAGSTFRKETLSAQSDNL